MTPLILVKHYLSVPINFFNARIPSMIMQAQIGKVIPENPFFLAPMEAVNCASFRVLCRRRGASAVYTDMIDADIFMEDAMKSGKESAVKRFVNPQSEEAPLAVQLGGAKIDNLCSAAEILQNHAAFIDYNAGCPLSYMLGKKGGVYLSKHPDQLYKIIKAMRLAITIPFTVKIRAGWDDATKNAPEVAKQLELLGVDAIAIHPRTRKQLYSERADWPLARKVKESVKVPVILSGDVTNTYMAHMAFLHTKCDFMMCARGAKNNPSLFSHLDRYWKGKREQPQKPLTLYDKKEGEPQKDFEEFLRLYSQRESRNSLTEIRDHALWTSRECANSDSVKQQLMSARDADEILSIIKRISFNRRMYSS
jgi:tRNA-dihydrouridine synthase B